MLDVSYGRTWSGRNGLEFLRAKVAAIAFQGTVPAGLETGDEPGIDACGDVGVDVVDLAFHDVAESACLGDLRDTVFDQPGFVGGVAAMECQSLLITESCDTSLGAGGRSAVQVAAEGLDYLIVYGSLRPGTPSCSPGPTASGARSLGSVRAADGWPACRLSAVPRGSERCFGRNGQFTHSAAGGIEDALAIAGATPTCTTSPSPLTPSGSASA